MVSAKSNAFKYLFRRNPGDVTEMIDQLAGTGVDVLTVLVGINDDLSWRGSPHGELWGECWGAASLVKCNFLVK